MGTIGDGSGTGYPGAIDSAETRSDGDVITANFQNDIQAVAIATQPVLGTNPQGTYPSVVARLDALESKAFADATERQLTAGDNTPQILQSDAIAAGVMSPARILNFEYFGTASTLALNALVLRIKYNATVLHTVSLSAQNAPTYPWRLWGTILMRDATRGEMMVQAHIIRDGQTLGEIYNFVYLPVTVDLSQAFTFALEAERNVAVNVQGTLFGSAIRIHG